MTLLRSNIHWIRERAEGSGTHALQEQSPEFNFWPCIYPRAPCKYPNTVHCEPGCP